MGAAGHRRVRQSDPATRGVRSRYICAIIGVRGGRIAVVAEAVSEGATTPLDVGGKVVTPGLIDLPVHVWWGVAHLGIEADPHCVRRGATTGYDAGSAGADTFPGFKKYVIDVSATRIKAFLHIASQGQLNNEIGELTDLRYADVDKAAAMCERYKEDIVGVKIRMTRNLVGDNGREGLKRARAVCEATGLPLMLHPNASPLNLADMLGQMQAGDIMTHCFHSSDTGVLDEAGKVRPEAGAASERGGRFDVGHGAGSFSFQVAETAMRQGLRPGTISSDLHHYNLHGPVYDWLPRCQSSCIWVGVWRRLSSARLRHRLGRWACWARSAPWP